MTRLQEWRRRRNLTIALASLQGASIRFLGDVFDLNPARVSRVMAGLRAEFADRGGLTSANLTVAMTRARAGKDRVESSQSRKRATIAA